MMRNFYKYILTIIAIFAATSLAAQLPYDHVLNSTDWGNSSVVTTQLGGNGNNNKWDDGIKFSYYKWTDATGGFNWNEKYVDIRLSNSSKKRFRCVLIIQASATLGKDYYFSISPSTDGVTFPDEWKWTSSKDQETMENGQVCELDLDKSVQYVRISYFGNLSGYCRDLMVSEIIGCDNEDLFTALNSDNKNKLKLEKGTNSQALELNCIPATLSFTYYGYDDNLSASLPKFSIHSSNSTNNSEKYTKSYGEFSANDAERWKYDVELNRDVKYIKFNSNISKNNLGNYITNARITPARFIEVSNVPVVPQNSIETTVDFGDVYIGYGEQTKSFYLTYSDVQNISLRETHQQVRLSESQIPIECGEFTPLGTSHEIKITLNPTEERKICDTIIITDEDNTQKATVIVCANIKRVTFEGNTDDKWKENNNWNCGRFPNDIRIPITVKADVTLPAGYFAVKEVEFEDDATLRITSESGLTIGEGGVIGAAADGSTITIENDLQGAGYLRISPEATNKDIKLTVDYTTRAVSGDAYEQVWQYVGAPGANPVMSSADNAKIYYWSETEGWVKHSAAFEPFKGYAISQKNNSNDTYTITATPIFSNHTVELTKTPKGMNGDNLFVNSYLAPIDLTTFTDYEDSENNPEDDFIGDFEKTFYLFNSGSLKNCYDNGGKGSEILQNGSAPGQYYAITPLGAALLDNNIEQTTIPPMQGVYVVANENGAKIRLNYERHVYKAQTNDMSRPMRAPQEQDPDFMRVRMQVNSDNSGADRMYVIQYDKATAGYDNGYDAKNILAEGQANIYTNEPDGKMEISVKDQIDSTYIGFAAGTDSEYTLTFTSLVGEDMYLKDFETQTITPIQEGEQYVFYAQPNSVNDMRFQLLLNPDFSEDEFGDGVTTCVDNILSSARIWVSDKKVYVTNAPANSTLAIYSVSGTMVVAPYTLHLTPYVLNLSHLPMGVYVLRLNNQAYKFICE